MKTFTGGELYWNEGVTVNAKGLAAQIESGGLALALQHLVAGREPLRNLGVLEIPD
jgi:hypothetical protein